MWYNPLEKTDDQFEDDDDDDEKDEPDEPHPEEGPPLLTPLSEDRGEYPKYGISHSSGYML